MSAYRLSLAIPAAFGPTLAYAERNSKVMHEFRKRYNDIDADEGAIEEANKKLREEVVKNMEDFKHPFLSKPWYWRVLYKIGRYVISPSCGRRAC